MNSLVKTKAARRIIERGTDAAGLGKRRDFAEVQNQARQRAIARWYRLGGRLFIQWVKRYYKTMTGQPLHWREPYQYEMYLAFGNPWLEAIVAEKGAQVGFSEMLIALTGFILSEVKVTTGLGFEEERKLRDMVPRIQTTFDFVEPIQQAKVMRRSATGRKDVDFRERQLTVAGVPVTFFYTSTSSRKKGQERQASSSMSSFTAWCILGDEIELWPAGALDIAKERQSACEMQTKPFRAGSTPGQEGGIVDTEVKMSGHCFMWRVQCPHCGVYQLMHPFGNLLRPVMQSLEDGTLEEQWLDPTGRALDWYSRDVKKTVAQLANNQERDRKIETAYVGCCECRGELSWDVIAAGQFHARPGDNPRCATPVKPDETVWLKELCDRVLKEQHAVHSTVAIRIPRLASTLFNATERIRKLVFSRNPVDVLQQGFGLSVSVGGGKISLPRLQQCCGLPLPEWCRDRPADVVVLGVDQGKAFNYGLVKEYWFPPDEEDPEQRWLKAFARVKWWGDIYGFDGVAAKCQEFGVKLVGMDNEPEIQLAANFARKSPAQHLELIQNQSGYSVFLFDQVELKGEDFRRTERLIQGEKFPMYALHRTAGLDWVRDRIYRKLQSFPADLNYIPGDDGNLVVHYLSSDRKTDGSWVQISGIPDHWFHADNFCEAALLASLFEPVPKRLAFGSFHRGGSP